MCKPSESAYALCAARRAGPRRGRTRHCTTTACPELLRVLGARALRCGFNAWRGGNASSASFLHMASDVLNVSRSPQFFGPHAGLSTFVRTCLCGILTRPWRQPGHFLPTPRVVGFSSGPTSVGFYEDLAPILMFANSKSSWFFSLGQAVCPCRIFTERWRRPGPLAVEVPRGWQLTFGIFTEPWRHSRCLPSP